jgi:hypothetical protein
MRYSRLDICSIQAGATSTLQYAPDKDFIRSSPHRIFSHVHWVAYLPLATTLRTAASTLTARDWTPSRPALVSFTERSIAAIAGAEAPVGTVIRSSSTLECLFLSFYDLRGGTHFAPYRTVLDPGEPLG